MALKVQPKKNQSKHPLVDAMDDKARLNILMPRSLRTALRVRCVSEDRTLTDVTLALLRGWLDGSIKLPKENKKK